MITLKETIEDNLLKNKSKNILHAAHSYYNINNISFSKIELLTIIASALFFKFFNPDSTIDFYGDKKTSNFIYLYTKKLNIYDNINYKNIEKFASKDDYDFKNFFSLPKFIALKDLYMKFNDPVCILDVDLITLKPLADIINKNSICCTHFELTNNPKIYPPINKINHSNKYRFSKTAYKYQGIACNTSILGFSNKKIAFKYINEVMNFMENNKKAKLSDLLWAEQVLLPIIAEENSIKIEPIIKSIYNPNTLSFIPSDWCYYYICSLLTKRNTYNTYHAWISKNLYKQYPTYSEYACLLLLKYMEIILSPKIVENILEIPTFAQLSHKFKKHSKNLIEFIYKCLFSIDSIRASFYDKRYNKKTNND